MCLFAQQFDVRSMSKCNDIVLESTTRCEPTSTPLQSSAGDESWLDWLIIIMHLLLPLTLTGIIWGRNAIVSRIFLHIDSTCIAVLCPRLCRRRKLLKWLRTYLPYMEGDLEAMWTDGSLLCSLINTAIPGACANPHRHWKKPPLHGQSLAFKYLNIQPIFNASDYNEQQMLGYLAELQAIFERYYSINYANQLIQYSNHYVARGVGLVTGEQHRKTTIYIYPNRQQHQHIDTLSIRIRGPYNTFGELHLHPHHNKMLDAVEPFGEIKLRLEYETDRVKLVFIPRNSGVYEAAMTTGGVHICGSPYNINIEKNWSGLVDKFTDDVYYLILNDQPAPPVKLLSRVSIETRRNGTIINDKPATTSMVLSRVSDPETPRNAPPQQQQQQPKDDWLSNFQRCKDFWDGISATTSSVDSSTLSLVSADHFDSITCSSSSNNKFRSLECINTTKQFDSDVELLNSTQSMNNLSLIKSKRSLIYARIRQFDDVTIDDDAKEPSELNEFRTIKRKIKERFEKAQTFFKQLEENGGDAVKNIRRTHTNGEFSSIEEAPLSSMLRHTDDDFNNNNNNNNEDPLMMKPNGDLPMRLLIDDNLSALIKVPPDIQHS